MADFRLFKDLNEEEKLLIESFLFSVNVKRGELVFEEGDTGYDLYLIKKGAVKVFLLRDGEEILLANLKEGDFFGEMAILREDTRSASVMATEDTILLRLSQDTFNGLIETHPDISCKVLMEIGKTLAQRIYDTNKHVEDFFYINQGLIENDKFRELYKRLKGASPSSKG